MRQATAQLLQRVAEAETETLLLREERQRLARSHQQAWPAARRRSAVAAVSRGRCSELAGSPTHPIAVWTFDVCRRFSGCGRKRGVKGVCLQHRTHHALAHAMDRLRARAKLLLMKT